MIYLYDAMFNTKKECTLDYIANLFKISKDKLNTYLKEEKSLRDKRWFLIDKSTQRKTILQFHSKLNVKYEAWKYIDGTNDEMMISSYGRVKNKDGKFLLSYQKQLKDGRKTGKFLRIKRNGVVKEYAISRLVAYHFVLASDKISFEEFNKYRVYHKNSFKHDDYFGNLKIKRVPQ